MRVAATGKARSPIVDSRVGWTGSDVVDADRRRVLMPRSAGWLSLSARYVGAVPCRWGEMGSGFPFISRRVAGTTKITDDDDSLIDWLINW